MASSRGYGWSWQVLRRLVLERDHYRCGWCNAEATTVDHVIARSAGGSDEPANLVAACWECQGRRARQQMREANGWA